MVENSIVKKVIVSVINDLVTDQRVDRVSSSLKKMGFDVCLVGRRRKGSLCLKPRAYQTKRMKLLFEKGPCFYMEYNFRLFFYLLFHKVDLLVSNDLDTLLANYLVSKIKRIPVVYDSHEYYTGVPELANRPFVRGIWKRLERWILPYLKTMYTVNASIAKLYKDEYGVDFQVVRNMPCRRGAGHEKSKSELGIPENKKIILLQGAGINVERGAEEAVEAMQFIEGALLLIIGGGDVIDLLKRKVSQLQLEKKVMFVPKVPFDELLLYTHYADIGLTLDKDTNINYRFSLPNKLFDYIQSQVPILASNLIEIKSIILHYHIGDFIENHNPVHIAQKMKDMLFNDVVYQQYKRNIVVASQELCWENEEKKLMEIYLPYAR